MSDTVIAIVIFDMLTIYLLLVGTAKLYGERCEHLRIFGASLFSAIHSGMVAVGLMSHIDSCAVRMVVLCATGALAFGVKKGSIYKLTVFLLLNAAFEGMLNGYHTTSICQKLIVAVMIMFLCIILRESTRRVKSYATVEIRHEGKLVCVEALRDTGNELTDVMTGLPVLVVGPNAASQLSGLTQEELAAPLETMQRRQISGLRLIPFSSVGNSNGLMLGVRFRDICVDGIPTDMVVGMAPDGVGKYEALIGGYHGSLDHKMRIQQL